MAWTDPRTWVAAEKPSAATLNQHIRDNLKAIGDAWTAYTPAWTAVTTNPVLGNGTLTGAALQAGKFIKVRIILTCGSTTTFGSGNYRFSLPVASASQYGAFTPLEGHAILQDASLSARYVRFPMGVTAGGSTIALVDVAGTQVSDTVPFTFANTDIVGITFTYEAA